MRNVMVSTIAEDYITMAQAKGLSDRRVMLKYAARNAILPSITGFAMSLGFVVGGAILVEYVFSYPGVGYELFEAASSEDYPMLQALLLFIVTAVLIANFIADIIYVRLDPRVPDGAVGAMASLPPVVLIEEVGQAGGNDSPEAFFAESSHRVRDFFEMLASNRKAAGGLAGLTFFIIIAIIGPYITPHSATTVNSVPYALIPSWKYWLGTTSWGKILLQLIVGTRASVGLALAAGFIATIISCVVGLTAGYLRGIPDDVLSLITNVFLVIPTLPILIVVAAYANSFGIQGVGLETAIIAATSWAWGARVLRSQMLTLREKDFVLASRVAGESWIPHHH